MTIPMLRKVAKPAKSVLDWLTEGLSESVTTRRVDRGGAGIMPVVVERVGPELYGVSHYYEQNGDLVADPDMVFWRGPDREWYPVEITQGPVGVYRRVLNFGDDGSWSTVDRRGQRELASFAAIWMRNIRTQQHMESTIKGERAS